MRFWDKVWLAEHEIYFRTVYSLAGSGAALSVAIAAFVVSCVQLSDGRRFASAAQDLAAAQLEIAEQQTQLLDAQTRVEAADLAPVLEIAETGHGYNLFGGPRLSLAILNTNRPVTDVRARTVQIVDVRDHRGDVERRVRLDESVETIETFGGEEQLLLILYTPGGHSILSINEQADGVFDGRNNRTLRGKVYIELSYRDASNELRTKCYYYDLYSDRILPTFGVPAADGVIDVNGLYDSEAIRRLPLVETAFREYSPYLRLNPTLPPRQPAPAEPLEPPAPEPPDPSEGEQEAAALDATDGESETFASVTRW